MKNRLLRSLSLFTAITICLLSSPGHSQNLHSRNRTKPIKTKPQNYKPSCTLPPIITCPLNFKSCPGVSTLPSNTGFATAKPGGIGCNQPIITYSDFIMSQGPCTGAIEIIRTWTATDPQDGNLKSSCDQMIKLADNEAPVINNCPPNMTVQANSNCFANVFWNPPSVIDNCGKLFLTVTHISGDKFPIGVTRVTYTAEDVCSNSSSCYFDITVEGQCCDKAPILTCANDYTGCPGDSILPKKTGTPSVKPGSPKCNIPVLIYKDSIASTGPCLGAMVIYRKWTAVDPYDTLLKSTCVQKITLKDDSAPLISKCPDNITVSPGTNCQAMVFWNLPIASDNCSSVNFSSNHNPGDFFSEGVNTINYTVSDACGNTATCAFTITVMTCCDKAPNMICPKDYEACPGTSIATTVTGEATATPGKINCGTPIISYTDITLTTGPCVGAKKIQRVWTAKDPNDSTLKTTCSQTIELRDIMPPSFTSCPSNMTVNTNTQDCKAQVSWVSPTVVDNCGIPFLSTNHVPGSIFEVGVTDVNYIATDGCGNKAEHHFTVTVINTCCDKAPNIKCPNDYEACPGTGITTNITGEATATPGKPNCGNPKISYTDVIISTGPCQGAKKIKRIWKAVDPNDSTLFSICNQIIELRDIMPPTFTSCPSNITVNTNTSDCKAVVTWISPTVTDNCGIPFLTTNKVPGSTFEVGVTQVVYVAMDGCGNKASHSFTVTVINTCCNKPPVITCPPTWKSCPTQACGPGNSGYATAVAGSPGCATPTISYRDSILSQGPCKDAKKFLRIWTATDPNTNLKSVCLQLIDMQDNEPPVFKYCPANITVDLKGQCDKQIKWDEPIVYDNCSKVILTSNYISGQTFTPGTYTIIYIATDACGNKAIHQFTLTVIGGGLKIECPKDIEVDRVDPTLNGAYVSWKEPKVNLCGPCPDSLKGCMYVGTYNGHKYFCSAQPDTWWNAKNKCQNFGGYLCVINDAQENEWVKNKIMGATAFIGLHDMNVEGYYEWVDGTPFTYSNWYPGQPNNANNDQDVCEMLPDGTWNDQYATTLREYICEMPCYELKQIAGPANGSLFPCGTTKVTYVAKQGNITDTCSFYVTVNCKTNTPNYCASKGMDSKYTWIECVELNNLNNCSGNNGGYADFTTLCAYTKFGATYNLCLTPGFIGSPYQVYWKIWIDYNEDYDFEDPGEFVAYGTGSSKLCGDITIPRSCACPSIITRMRVSMAYGGYPANSCCLFSFGEVEDYCIALGAGANKIETRSSSDEMDPVLLQCAANCKSNNKISTDVIQLAQGLGNVLTEETSHMVIHPNPVHDVVNIKLLNAGIQEIRLFDLLGKQVYYEKNINPLKNKELDVQTFKSGTYMLQVKDQTGRSYIDKIQIEH